MTLDAYARGFYTRLDDLGSRYAFPHKEGIARGAGITAAAVESATPLSSLVTTGVGWTALGTGLLGAAAVYGVLRLSLSNWERRVAEEREAETRFHNRRVFGVAKAAELMGPISEGSPDLEERAGRVVWKLIRAGVSPGEAVYEGITWWKTSGRLKRDWLMPARMGLGVPAEERVSYDFNLQTGESTVKYKREGVQRTDRVKLCDLVETTSQSSIGRVALYTMEPDMRELMRWQDRERNRPPVVQKLGWETGMGFVGGWASHYVLNSLGLDLSPWVGWIPGAGFALAVAGPAFDFSKEVFVDRWKQKREEKKDPEVRRKEEDLALLLQHEIARRTAAEMSLPVNPHPILVFDSPLRGRVKYIDLSTADGLDMQTLIQEIPPEVLKRDYLGGLSPEEYLRDPFVRAELVGLKCDRKMDIIDLRLQRALRRMDRSLDKRLCATA